MMTSHNECETCGAMVVGLKNNAGEMLRCDAEPITVIGALGDYNGFRPHSCPREGRKAKPAPCEPASGPGGNR